MSAKIFFEKNEYYPGETATARIICDNSQCDKDIKEFKFELISLTNGSDGKGWSASNYSILRRDTLEGMPRGEQGEREFTINIPRKCAFPEWQKNHVRRAD